MYKQIFNILRKRYEISSTTLALLMSLFFVFIANNPFWQRVYSSIMTNDDTKYGFLISFSVSVFLLTFLIFNLFSIGYFVRMLAALVLLTSSVALYFMTSYGVIIDKSMVQNVIETDSLEAFDLISSNVIIYFLFYGVVPVYVLTKLDFTKQSLLNEIKIRVWHLLITVFLIVILVFPFSKNYTLLLRNHRELRYLYSPFNYLYSISSLVSKSLKVKGRSLISISDGARVKNGELARKKVIVLVVGETARAQNFSLNGYERDTNPLLKKKKIVNFTNVYSCGTSTSVSLPCLFSHLGKKGGGDGKKVKEYENLLDLLNGIGVQVLWKENNSGCKGICDRVETQNIKYDSNNSLCGDGKCQDELLLNGLKERIDSTARDSFIVLHVQGSHGPAYYRRYPKEFKKYTPTCDTAQIENCVTQNIVNTYDNTILYTDYFLSKIINLLENQSQKYDVGMIYVSDHGESLGEGNIYLHGSPYYIAPDNQIHVPLIIWLSNELENALSLKYNCLLGITKQNYTHDNIFHTILGIFNIETPKYNQNMDILKRCVLK